MNDALGPVVEGAIPAAVAFVTILAGIALFDLFRYIKRKDDH